MEKYTNEFKREVDGLHCPEVNMSEIMRGHQRYKRHAKHYKIISMCLIAVICAAGSSVAIPAGVWTADHLISTKTGWAVKGDGGYVVDSDKKSKEIENGSENQYIPETSNEADKVYSDIAEAEKATGLDLPDVFKDSGLNCTRVRILNSNEDSYSMFAVYIEGDRKVNVTIDYGEGITGDAILPYTVKEKKWITTRDGSRILMQSGSGQNEIDCAAYRKDYIVSMNFEDCTVDEAEAMVEEADLSDLKN